MLTPSETIELEMGMTEVETETVFNPSDWRARRRFDVENKMLSVFEGLMHRPF